MLGADHHGYIARLKAAAAALGDDPDTVEVLIGQMVNLVRDGQPVRISKRAGTVITLDDLVDAIGVDAARYALIRSSVDTSDRHRLAAVVIGVQRKPGLLRAIRARSAVGAGTQRRRTGASAGHVEHLDLLTHEKKATLIRNLGDFAGVLNAAARCANRTGCVATWRTSAGDYHRFYDSCRVLPQGDEESRRPAHGRGSRCARRRGR